LVQEQVAEMIYQPAACQTKFRLIIVRKDLDVREKNQLEFFENYVYQYYITNDWKSTPTEIVFAANDRCQQENLVAQLGAIRALHAPVDTLLSNEAYMLITSLGWNLKAWLALLVPVATGSKREAQTKEKQRLLRMEFRTFVNYFVRMPTQIAKTGRKIVVRLLAWNVWQPVFFRLAAHLSKALHC
jgi:hypothetical protein